MAIPKELNYRNEDDFTQRLLVPLLQRLGFSMTVNYHGSREFGRDLIFAEFDRFGHVRYHALQAKFIDSISVNTVRDLIADAELSFINPFRHPQTGTQEHINTFYAVNGGSIAEGAVTTYFAALTPRYGSNVRLLAGKDVIARRQVGLSKSVTVNFRSRLWHDVRNEDQFARHAGYGKRTRGPSQRERRVSDEPSSASGVRELSSTTANPNIITNGASSRLLGDWSNH